MEFIEYTTEYLLKGVLAEFGEQNIPARIQRQAIDAMYRVTQAHWYAEDDAIPTLELLRAQGYRLGLVSNASDEQDVQTLIDQTGLRRVLRGGPDLGGAGHPQAEPENLSSCPGALGERARGGGDGRRYAGSGYPGGAERRHLQHLDYSPGGYAGKPGARGHHPPGCDDPQVERAAGVVGENYYLTGKKG